MPIVCITGASAGIGEATAELFAREGWAVAIGARRTARLEEVARRLAELGASAVFHAKLDVTQEASIEEFVSAMTNTLGTPDCLVNNAGLARGAERVAEADGRAWREMIETNIFGLLWMTRRVLPAMLERGSGHLIMIGSVAGHLGYAGGSVYCATKSSVRSICEALRLETLGRGIRVTSVDPGAAETEFSLVRYSGDADSAAKVYAGFEPLHAIDVAECVLFAATRPDHVNLDQIRVMATAQADPWHVHRVAPE